jgi:hypothetical protein
MIVSIVVPAAAAAGRLGAEGGVTAGFGAAGFAGAIAEGFGVTGAAGVWARSGRAERETRSRYRAFMTFIRSRRFERRGILSPRAAESGEGIGQCFGEATSSRSRNQARANFQWRRTVE